MELSLIKTIKIEEPLFSAIFTFMANEHFIDGEEESGKNRSIALNWRANHLTIVGKIKVAVGIKRAIDVEIYNFRRECKDLMCVIILQGGDWESLAKMQHEVEDFIRKVIFNVGDQS